MKPEIRILDEKKLIGKRIKMSYTDNKTHELWRSFMTGRKEIQNSIGTELYSVEVYPPAFFENFNPGNDFEKWAAIEVTDFDNIPDSMETIIIPEGNYAVFVHKGLAGKAPETYGFIFKIWLPGSEFLLDNRPHLAIMGEKYKNEDPDSEEEIWIPVKTK